MLASVVGTTLLAETAIHVGKQLYNWWNTAPAVAAAEVDAAVSQRQTSQFRILHGRLKTQLSDLRQTFAGQALQAGVALGKVPNALETSHWQGVLKQLDGDLKATESRGKATVAEIQDYRADLRSVKRGLDSLREEVAVNRLAAPQKGPRFFQAHRVEADAQHQTHVAVRSVK